MLYALSQISHVTDDQSINSAMMLSGVGAAMAFKMARFTVIHAYKKHRQNAKPEAADPLLSDACSAYRGGHVSSEDPEAQTLLRDLSGGDELIDATAEKPFFWLGDKSDLSYFWKKTERDTEVMLPRSVIDEIPDEALRKRVLSNITQARIEGTVLPIGDAYFLTDEGRKRILKPDFIRSRLVKECEFLGIATNGLEEIREQKQNDYIDKRLEELGLTGHFDGRDRITLNKKTLLVDAGADDVVRFFVPGTSREKQVDIPKTDLIELDEKSYAAFLRKDAAYMVNGEPMPEAELFLYFNDKNKKKQQITSTVERAEKSVQIEEATKRSIAIQPGEQVYVLQNDGTEAGARSDPLALIRAACTPDGGKCEFSDAVLESIVAELEQLPGDALPLPSEPDPQVRRAAYLRRAYRDMLAEDEIKRQSNKRVGRRDAYLKGIIRKDIAAWKQKQSDGSYAGYDDSDEFFKAALEAGMKEDLIELEEKTFAGRAEQPIADAQIAAQRESWIGKQVYILQNDGTEAVAKAPAYTVSRIWETPEGKQLHLQAVDPERGDLLLPEETAGRLFFHTEESALEYAATAPEDVRSLSRLVSAQREDTAQAIVLHVSASYVEQKDGEILVHPKDAPQETIVFSDDAYLKADGSAIVRLQQNASYTVKTGERSYTVSDQGARELLKDVSKPLTRATVEKTANTAAKVTTEAAAKAIPPAGPVTTSAKLIAEVVSKTVNAASTASQTAAQTNSLAQKL